MRIVVFDRTFKDLTPNLTPHFFIICITPLPEERLTIYSDLRLHDDTLDTRLNLLMIHLISSYSSHLSFHIFLYRPPSRSSFFPRAFLNIIPLTT